MDPLRCYSCEREFAAALATVWATCPGCGTSVHLPTARRVAAVSRVARSVDSEGDLEDVFRAQLQRQLLTYRRQAIESAPALSVPDAGAASEPPPEPSALPPPLPATLPRLVAATPPRRAVPDLGGPSLWSRLGPVFAENVLFALAAFLLVAGAVYFTTTAWTTMSGTTQKLVVAGALLLFAALTHGAGVALAKGRGLLPAARVLSMVAAALVPTATAVTGLLCRDEPLLAIAAAVVAAAVGHCFLRTVLRRDDGPQQRLAPWLYDLLVFLGVCAPSLSNWRLSSSCAAAAFPLLVAALLRRAERERGGGPVTIPSLALWLATTLAAMTFATNLALAANATWAVAIAPIGVVVAAAALALAVLESAGRSPAPARLVSACAAAIVGTAMASGDSRCLMVAAWCAALVAGQSSLRVDQARFLVPALALSAIGYLFLPAPVRELAMQWRADAAGRLGYAPERLPLSFYGVTFLPYLGLLALLAWWFLRTDRARHRRIVGVWAMSVASGLVAMALLLGSDLRAPMVVLPADGLLLIVLGYLAQSASAVFAGCLGVLGGLCCVLIWLDVPAGVATVAVATAALGLLHLAGGPKVREGFPARVVRSYFAAALVAVAAHALWLLTQAWPPAKATPWSLLHAVTLVPTVVLLRRLATSLLARQALLLLSLPALWTTATGVAATLAWLGVAEERAALPVALAFVTGFVAWLLPHVADRAAHRPPVAAFAIGMFALHVGLLPGLVEGWRLEPFAWSTIVGLATLAVAGGVLAFRAQVPVLLAVAVAEGAVPLYLLAGAWLGTAAGPPGLVGPAALALGARLLAGRLPIAITSAAMAALLAFVLVAWRLAMLPVLPAATDAWAGLICAALLALQVVLLRSGTSAVERAVGTLSLGAAASAVLLLPVFALDLLATRLPHYAIGFLGVGGLCFAVARLRAPASLLLAGSGLWHTALAVLLTFVWMPNGIADHRLRLGLFAAAVIAAAACRPRALRTASTWIAMAALAGAAVVQPVALGWIPVRWWPVAMLVLCAVALAAAAHPRFRARALAVRLVAVPPVLCVALLLGGQSMFAAITEPAREARDMALSDAMALAFFAAALAWSTHWSKRRALVVWTAAALAAFVTTPANALLHGHRGIWFRPDLEAALLTLAIAVHVRTNPVLRAFVLGLVAAGLTVFDVRDVSTAATVTVLAGAPLALLLRRQPGPMAWWHGLLLIAAAWSWIALLLVGEPTTAFGPWLALSAAAVATALGPWLRAVGSKPDELLATRASAWLLTLGAVVTHVVRVRQPMTIGELGSMLVACVVVAAGSGSAARIPARAPLVHLALVAVVAGYAAVARGTDWLAPLDGRHHHALTVLGVTLFLAAGGRDSPLRRQLFGAAVVLPILAVMMAMALGGLCFALLAGAAAFGFGALLGRARWLGALALLLGNAGLFDLWLDKGVFDPSFYGVPAGLSLVFGAELARAAMGPTRVTALRLVGLSVLYGSVLVQVLRVSAPMHALVLFALAMAAVAWGSIRRQAPVLVAGVAAIVLDVVAYLAQRGFEQDFLGSILLVGAGGAVFVVAARAARRRARNTSPAA